MGQLVTPQKTAVMPAAVHKSGQNPVRLPNRQPKAAPVKNEGTISPPLNPAPSVTAVKSIFKKKASGATDSDWKKPSIMSIPVPL